MQKAQQNLSVGAAAPHHGRVANQIGWAFQYLPHIPAAQVHLLSRRAERWMRISDQRASGLLTAAGNSASPHARCMPGLLRALPCELTALRKA